MCGIALVFGADDGAEAAAAASALAQQLLSDIRSRGTHSASVNLSSVSGICRDVWCMSSVLHIQGEEAAAQPHVDCHGNMLQWNGEVFAGLDLQHGESDTSAVASLLANIAESCRDSAQGFIDRVALEMSRIQGPFAFTFYNARLNAICYGRDPFGRRSLLSLDSPSGLFAVASCCTEQGGSVGPWSELPIGGLHLCLVGGAEGRCYAPWPADRITLARRKRIDVGDMRYGHPSRAAPEFLRLLRLSLARRVQRLGIGLQPGGCCPVGVLFSGGIDSVLLAALLHDCVPPGASIDLLNVTFDEHDAERTNSSHSPSPDRLAAVAAARELKELYPTRDWRLVHVDVDTREREASEERIIGLIKPLNTYMDLNIGAAFWFAARGEGYLREYSDVEIDGFFGLTDNDVPLLRVSAGGAVCVETAAERIEAQHCGEDKRCPTEGCRWVAKKGCVHRKCSKCCRAACHTAVDASVLCPAHSKRERKNIRKMAAAGGIDVACGDGFAETDSSQSARVPYVSKCRVVLVGIGADEQLAGYGRHRTVHKKGTEREVGRGELSLLEQELDKDVTRLWKRNLGRDDRCISDHTREMWTPYLDEELVQFIQSLAIEEIADLSLESGVGDKMILRQAASLLGLSSRVCGLVKRAIQFGTRVAKHTNRKHHGSSRKVKGDMLLDDDA